MLEVVESHRFTTAIKPTKKDIILIIWNLFGISKIKIINIITRFCVYLWLMTMDDNIVQVINKYIGHYQ